MPENAALLERREELKRALDKNNNRTLVDRLLDGANRPFRRLIGKQPALSVIFGMVIISLITIFIGILLAGEGPGEVTHLIDDGSWPGDPVWSPDGRAIIFVSGWCRGWVCGNDIAYIAADGTSRRQIVADGWAPAVRPR